MLEDATISNSMAVTKARCRLMGCAATATLALKECTIMDIRALSTAEINAFSEAVGQLEMLRQTIQRARAEQKHELASALDRS